MDFGVYCRRDGKLLYAIRRNINRYKNLGVSLAAVLRTDCSRENVKARSHGKKVWTTMAKGERGS